MQKTIFETKHSLSMALAPLALATLLGALAVGCGETDDGPADPPFGGTGGQVIGTPGGGGTTGGGAITPPATTGGGQVTPPATTGGGQVTPPATTGGGQVTPPPATTGGGGSADTPWCKVKKITDAKCVACHTTPLAAGAPFPLEKYADFVAPHPTKTGKKIYERVGFRVHAEQAQTEKLGVMPPGAQLPADQLAVIDSWIAAGAPQGDNPTCAGATAGPGGGTGGTVKPVDDTWPLPECDATYKIVSHGSGGATSPYMVQPKQEIHPQVPWDAPWGTEEVQAIGFKAVTDNKAVLHHWILYAQGGGFLTGWAPGEDGVKRMAPDVGMKLPSGKGSLRLDMHYNSLTQTTAQADNSGLEVCIVKKAKFRKNTAAVTMGLAGIPIIPANSKGVQIKSSCTVGGSTPITLLSASPHAHTYARRMIFTVKRKSGEMITMHDMPFMFGEQKSYPLDPPVVVQPGDTINTTCVYDNDTSRQVTFGENTGNEMCFNFALYYPAGALSCGGGLGGLIGGGF